MPYKGDDHAPSPSRASSYQTESRDKKWCGKSRSFTVRPVNDINGADHRGTCGYRIVAAMVSHSSRFVSVVPLINYLSRSVVEVPRP